MANIIKIKQSSVASRVPQAVDLEQGELAINTNDEKLYTKNSSGSVVELGRIPSIDIASDTNITSIADGQVLRYDASTSMWLNVSMPTFYEQTTEPSSPVAGDTWYDQSEGKIFMRVALSNNAGAWIEIGTEEITAYDGGDSDQTAYTAEISAGDASTTTYTETLDGGSA
jgi:hypothetical protein